MQEKRRGNPVVVKARDCLLFSNRSDGAARCGKRWRWRPCVRPHGQAQLDRATRVDGSDAVCVKKKLKRRDLFEKVYSKPVKICRIEN